MTVTQPTLLCRPHALTLPSSPIFLPLTIVLVGTGLTLLSAYAAQMKAKE